MRILFGALNAIIDMWQDGFYSLFLSLVIQINYHMLAMAM